MKHKKMARMYREAEARIHRGWVQGCHAASSAGQLVHPNSVDAECWCLEGAVILPDDPYGELFWVAEGELLHHLNHEIAAWNDAPERTQDEVAELLALAAEYHEAAAEGRVR